MRTRLGFRSASAVVATAAVAVVAAGIVQWRRTTTRLVGRLLEVAPRAAGEPVPLDPARIAALPAPVARYLAWALPEGRPRVRTARIRWSGEFQLRPGGGWKPFEAVQHFTTSPPGFVWDARVHVLPLVPVHVRDGYVAGEGTMLGRAVAVATVVDQRGTRELAAGALARWLGEAAWLPTAFVPEPDAHGNGIRWEAVDDATARATVTDGAITVSADFHFLPTGELARMTALRWRDVNGTAVLTPFEGVYRDWARRGGVMVPTSAEVAWLLPEGRFAYWRGRPDAVAYDAAGPGAASEP